MDENLLTLLEELSLRTSANEDEIFYSKESGSARLSSNYTSSSNVSSPNFEQLAGTNSADEDLELKSAVNSLFQELKPSTNLTQTDSHLIEQKACDNRGSGVDKSKLLVALLGNIDLVTCAVKKINQFVSLGKRLEHIYRQYYIDPNADLDLDELSQLIAAFTTVYNSEQYVREVNVSRVYLAYCNKLITIYQSRMNVNLDEQMMA